MQRQPPAKSRQTPPTALVAPRAGSDRPAPPTEPEHAKHVRLAVALLAAVTFLAFSRALTCEFVNLDDTTYVVQNKTVKAGLTKQGVVWAFTTFESANWHPLTWLSLELDASLWKLDPLGFHLTNVVLHAANAALLFLALRALTGAFWRSVAVALLFAVHPLRVESVAWVSERKDVLSSLFGLLALWGYALYVRNPSVKRYLWVVMPFALSLLAKPMFVTLPCLLLVLDWWPLGRARSLADWRRLVVEKLPLVAVTVLSSIVTFRAQAEGGAVMDLTGFSPQVRLENAVVSYAVYLGKTLWPAGLSPYYPHPVYGYDGGGLSPALVGGALVVLLGLTAGAIALRRRAPYLLTGWLWYLGTLVPVIGLVQVGGQAYADRYTYFPQIGLLLGLCWGVADLVRGRAQLAFAATAVTAVTLAGLTVSQLQAWRNSDALWNHAYRVVGKCPTVLVNLGECLEKQGHNAEAFAYFQDALRLDPNSAQIRLDVGNELKRQGKLIEAADQFREACRLAPRSPGGYSNLGDIFLRQGNVKGARDQYEKACQVAPDLGEAFLNLGLAEYELHNYARSADSYRRALELKPEYTRARIGLGAALVRAGDPDEGLALLRGVTRDEPESVEAHYRFGEALREQRDLDGAAEEFELAVRVNEKALASPRALDPARAAQVYREMAAALQQLGLVRLRQGRDAEGVGCLARAVEIDAGLMPRVRQALADAGQPVLADRVQERLRSGQRSRGSSGPGQSP
jgi:tetratricopeptide (TPR) repeat protein